METTLPRRAAMAPFSTIALFALSLAAPATPQPQGEGEPAHRRSSPLRVPVLAVRAHIQDAVASTEVEQTIRNDGQADAEAQWLLPLPAGATADGFRMTVGGQELAAEVLDAQRARAIYEQIVRQRRDPGLLEYFGEGCLRARIFPIPAHGEVKVKVRWRQILPHAGGRWTWSFPLRAPAATGLAAERTSLDVVLTSSKPLGNVYSPLPGFEVVRRGSHEARASMEFAAAQSPPRDPSVLFALAEREFGVNLLTWRRPGEAGYYLLMLAPGSEHAAPRAAPKLVQFVLDTSGSMQGRKIEQARAALRFFVRSLAPHDRFNVIPFATDAEPFFPAPVEAGAEQVAAALARIDRLEARGGTNIEDALRRALAAGPVEGVALPIVLFLTDGEPTVGTTDRDKLLALVRDQNRARARLFVLGVGDQVNAKLLDQLADENGGARDYIREDEDLEVKTGDLLTKLGHPALTDVSVTIDGLETTDTFPRRMPDLFKTSQLVVVGRYRGEGQRAIRLRGVLDGTAREFVYEGEFPAQAAAHDFVPALWAERKVAQLLDAIRLHGRDAELLRELQALAKEFGILTPYTSHLIVEEQARLGGLAPGSGVRGPATPGPSGPATGALPPAESAERLARLGRDDAGGEAVADSRALRSGTEAFFRGGPRREETKAQAALVRTCGARTLYRAGEAWVEQGSPADWAARAERIVAFSAKYFALLDAHPDLRPLLALGESLVLRAGARLVRIVPAPN